MVFICMISMTTDVVYRREPQKPMQAWLRRDPPKGTPSWSERSRSALLKMNKTLLARMEMLRSAGNLSELGKVALCKKGENNFAAEIRKAAIEEIKDRKEREAFAADLEANRRKFTRQLGKQIKDEMRKAEGSSGLLHDHIPLTCNADDFLRMCGVPKEPGANFRQMEGVVTHSDGTCCAGHTHAYRRNGRSACPGGGTLEKPRSTTSKEGRVDITDKGGWRGTKLEGCDSKTVLLPSGDLLCPRWCITYKGGKSDGRHGCFGRVDLFGIQPTVVTRAEPHNLQIVHPNEDRVLSIREMARCQGFPDYYTLVGTHGSNSKLKSLSRPEYIESRYCQIGNAVAPPVAAAMGRCLTLAASGEADPMRPVVAVPDQEMEKVLRQAIDNGLTFYATEMGEEGEAMELGDSAEEDNDLEQDDLD
ncbi:unnamed protein product [Ostreobium quekettii]|uniref:DNA (cytosine-5-)-methyltransferase n=1 Tax=Ostreobium quekettii TaxID=121088 RepID=A0A8S1IQE1_9CHLO|nr:unnamed protein product [Ostreobium quekettii]|eukprot:evm.model.scf_2200.1 EVM.evm.TU.scf_2200.1   scf_2200:5420-11991(+)